MTGRNFNYKTNNKYWRQACGNMRLSEGKTHSPGHPGGRGETGKAIRRAVQPDTSQTRVF